MRKWTLLLFVLLAINFIFYSDTLNFYFTSDDFFYISFQSLKDAVSFKPELYHYSPVFWIFMWGIRTIFGINSLVYHLVAVLLHLANIMLVYYLTKILLKSYLSAILASILFSLFFSHYEVVYWVTGIHNSLMLIFYLLGLIIFIKFVQKPNKLRYLLFNILFALSLLTHEYAISLPVIAVLYWIIIASKRQKISKPITFLLWPFISIVVLVLVKKIFSQTTLVVNYPSLGRFTASIVKSFLYLFLPFPQIIDSSPKIVLPIIFIIIIIFIFFHLRKNIIRQFLFGWILITVVIFSATSLPQARYFYLSSVPAILILVSIINLKVIKWNINSAVKLSYLSMILVFSISFLQKQKSHWRQASKIIVSSINFVKENNPDPVDTLYFINLPDSINGPPWNAYVFRSGLDRALELKYGQRVGKLEYFRTKSIDGKIREDTKIDVETLYKLKANGSPVFMYDWQNQQLENF